MNNQSPFVIVFTHPGEKPLVLRSRKGAKLNEWSENPVAAMPFDTIEAGDRIANKIHKEENKPRSIIGYDGLRVMRIGSTAWEKLFGIKYDSVIHAHKALKAMLEAWQEQFGDDACDCMPEPQNAGHVCQCCQAKQAIKELEESFRCI